MHCNPQQTSIDRLKFADLGVVAKKRTGAGGGEGGKVILHTYCITLSHSTRL